MSEQTLISWADSTINFWIGCTKVSPGCKNCYADEQDARRFSRTLGGGTKENPISHWGKGAPRYKVAGAVKDALAFNRKPFICESCGEGFSHQCQHDNADGKNKSWTNRCVVNPTFHRRRIFSLSLGDWLDAEVPIEWLAEMLDTIRQCDQVTWILCTKRPENWKERLARVLNMESGMAATDARWNFIQWLQKWLAGYGAPPNIILLTSVENQAMADKRIPELLKIPAARHGLSLEPLLSPVDLTQIESTAFSKLKGRPAIWDIDWAIIGCESGSKRRDCDNVWIDNLVEQCRSASVATFVKQVLVEGKVEADPTKFPPRLQIQQWPKGF